MSDCSCGGVSISCSGGCGCVCAGGSDCWRWCEPTVVEASSPKGDAVPGPKTGRGPIARVIRQADGTERLYLNAMVAGADLPRHARGTVLQGCMKGSTLGNMALVLGMLHGVSVTAPASRADETLDEPIAGTLEEIAEHFGLSVA